MPSSSQAEPPTSARLAVGAVIVDRAGRVVLVKRGHPPSAGSWSLPGGRMEAGESTEEAVLREVHEETALHARVVCPLGVAAVAREGFSYSIHEYLLVTLDDIGPLRAGDDAADARWVGQGDLASLGVQTDVVEVIDRGLVEARARGLIGQS